MRAADRAGIPVVIVQLWPQADWRAPFVLSPFVVECRTGEGFPVPAIAERIAEAAENPSALAVRVPVLAPPVEHAVVRSAIVALRPPRARSQARGPARDRARAGADGRRSCGRSTVTEEPDADRPSSPQPWRRRSSPATRSERRPARERLPARVRPPWRGRHGALAQALGRRTELYGSWETRATAAAQRPRSGCLARRSARESGLATRQSPQARLQGGTPGPSGPGPSIRR